MTSVSGSGERILAILDLFSEARPVWLPEEMMERLGYSRPTLYRYLKTLKDSGYLTSLNHDGFTLGPRVTELDYLMRRADPMISAGAPVLSELAEKFPGSALLVRWYGDKLLCVSSVVSTETPRTSYPRGRPMPLGKGAISRAIVAFLPTRARRKYIEDHLQEFSVAGVGATVDSVLTTLRQVRRDGVATAWGEVTSGVVGVAAPVLGPDHSPQGAVCLTSDEADITDTRLEQIRHAVRISAANVAGHMIRLQQDATVGAT
jgi:DNA-binding IclR family transcriptional regulator